jgi:hypothetical protein
MPPGFFLHVNSKTYRTRSYKSNEKAGQIKEVKNKIASKLQPAAGTVARRVYRAVKGVKT